MYDHKMPFPILIQVEDAVSRAADGTSAVQDLDLSALRLQLGPLASVRALIMPHL